MWPKIVNMDMAGLW